VTCLVALAVALRVVLWVVVLGGGSGVVVEGSGVGESFWGLTANFFWLMLVHSLVL
jgi:hypothetical protein